ncbi:hypothetical protein G9A89_010193 [Geosiphon pyriformis]|nr:hypothetical protein G9A89_010193 [Geosiphon pyriformis]
MGLGIVAYYKISTLIIIIKSVFLKIGLSSMGSTQTFCKTRFFPSRVPKYLGNWTFKNDSRFTTQRNNSQNINKDFFVDLSASSPKDFHTLVLVNRHWCQIIATYIACMNKEDITSLLSIGLEIQNGPTFGIDEMVFITVLELMQKEGAILGSFRDTGLRNPPRVLYKYLVNKPKVQQWLRSAESWKFVNPDEWVNVNRFLDLARILTKVVSAAAGMEPQSIRVFSYPAPTEIWYCCNSFVFLFRFIEYLKPIRRLAIHGRFTIHFSIIRALSRHLSLLEDLDFFGLVDVIFCERTCDEIIKWSSQYRSSPDVSDQRG